jgi:hypothetical protein
LEQKVKGEVIFLRLAFGKRSHSGEKRSPGCGLGTGGLQTCRQLEKPIRQCCMMRVWRFNSGAALQDLQCVHDAECASGDLRLNAGQRSDAALLYFGKNECELALAG